MSARTASVVNFELVTTGAALDVSGLWRPGASHAQAADIAFGIGQPETDVSVEPVLWRVRLPSDVARAAATLDSAGIRLNTSMGALGQFERDMDRTVRAFRFEASELQSLAQRLQDFLSGIGDLLRCHAVIETLVEEQRIGWSRLPRFGRVHTVLAAGLDPGQMRLHVRAVDLAIRSRAALMRMLVAILHGAALLSTIATTPLGPVIGLCAAWKLVDDACRSAR